jgi:hypothetical protein
MENHKTYGLYKLVGFVSLCRNQHVRLHRCSRRHVFPLLEADYGIVFVSLDLTRRVTSKDFI